ncbi:MAG: valine--tRNA ligase [Deltaproteobacteria bacterium RIFCSPLOWO2_12_FULL_44_12]|nr:MAG: valine--tRNA ligase [Deltaproteobacteria bacterium RIFCSPHIGHO2_01_FULL_43_49]OGQ14667.1 MAG: valine--tRNA ligase [Deltaproteobacteria bacterium RIFCSPHIGHO2_02_FULL_44_53]OGQ28053.1 MAG: valine--tRNA ligase [Deltaproteobacteria bacterium RIFCSPHIGHO2_12_FULL_44_21]OGQ31265.1 MAG: valine--tRNA ligase [Deltaproteobacteria bacterium RIFCSPLOWO2_01_FULL_45_74]OGQ43257.1 MAG: valine--tRNA ligase [Deltaproteobacteria bacterium RIFCSPLOWO2_02_FULL_44_34]OGQ70730.1 MAG: valine--tRNA ligase [D
MSQELAKAYDPKEVEQKWYSFWLEKNLFKAQDSSKKKPYCIVIPPPNVTGALHMGHALNNTLQDILIRWRRMQGFETLWQPGTDHAGIATQNVVEREILAKEGKSRHDVGRDELIKKIWVWKEQYGDRILKQLEALGATCDWSRTRFTLDEGLSDAVRECFVQLYKKKLIYRGNYIVNWCPRCRTALADDEVEHEEHKGHLWYIRYPFKNQKSKIKNQKLGEHLVVATTRPETMLGDTAVAVNPKDKRYKDWIGKTLILPEVGRELSIIADNFVDPKFGTGCVKVTPAHDPNDFQMGLRHKLPQINVMNADATMNDNTPQKYRGMKREICRKHLVENLQAQGLIEKIEEHTHSVGHCYRCNTVIEPWLSEQWFVKMKPLAKKAIEATKKKKVRFFPGRWEKFYLSWLNEVRDWCISRQIWWGHRIPVWYCTKKCPPIVSRETPQRCPKCGSTQLEQDPDVLDTWFSSALWPFSTLGWPKKTKSLQKFYPTSTLVTDRGIIFFWVARMVMMGLELMKKEPFHHVYIHGTILDEFGRKMSKSIPETCIDPMDIIQKYGADALRYSLVLLATEGQDLKLVESKFETGKHFCNKLWNATRFALMNLQNYDGKEDSEKNLSFADRWIWNRLQTTIQRINKDLEAYHYYDAAQTLYRFIWNEFCDWYLELIKPTVTSNHATQWNLHRTLETVLRLAHPFLPFVTEELWQHMNGLWTRDYGLGTSIVISEYPKPPKKIPFGKEAKEMEIIQNVVSAVRNLRGEHHVNPKQKIEVSLKTKSKMTRQVLTKNENYLKNLSQISQLKFLETSQAPSQCAVAVVDDLEVFVPFQQLFDITQERARMEKEIAKARQELSAFEGKLANKNFVERAPKEVVEKEKLRFKEHQERLNKLQSALEQLK